MKMYRKRESEQNKIRQHEIHEAKKGMTQHKEREREREKERKKETKQKRDDDIKEDIKK